MKKIFVMLMTAALIMSLFSASVVMADDSAPEKTVSAEGTNGEKIPGEGSEEEHSGPGDGADEYQSVTKDGTDGDQSVTGDGTDGGQSVTGDGTDGDQSVTGNGTEEVQPVPGDGTEEEQSLPGDGEEEKSVPEDGAEEVQSVPGDSSEEEAGPEGESGDKSSPEKDSGKSSESDKKSGKSSETDSNTDRETEETVDTEDKAEKAEKTSDLKDDKKAADSKDGKKAAADEKSKEALRTDESDAGKISLKDAFVTGIVNKTYTGGKITQSITVKVVHNGNEITLRNGTDYKVSYVSNTDIGKAHLIVNGIGKYTDRRVKAFMILPKKSYVSGLAVSHQQIKVTWTQQDYIINGYLLQYSTSKDFSENVSSLKMTNPARKNAVIKGLTSGKKYYFRIRTYRNVGGTNYYSQWSGVKSAKLTYNTLAVTGSGTERMLKIQNPKSSLTNARVAVWSNTNDQDDIKWYDLKKASDGTWSVKLYAAYLKHSGEVIAHVYTDSATFINDTVFSFSKTEFNESKNTVRILGSGDTRTVKLLNPKSAYKSVRVAVWTKAGDQDDIRWYALKKASDGSWSVKISMDDLLHSGMAYAHVYANKETFLREATFTAPVKGFEACSTEEEYINKIAPSVVNACKKYGYLPSVLIAQSCLENGYGIPSYWDNPEISALIRYNNMVGMKASLLNSSWYDKTVWTGGTVVKKTPEEYDGQRVIITDTFRTYENIQQSFEDFLLFLTYASNYGYGGAPKYGPEVISIKDPETLIRTVSGRGYATDSSYADSVMRIIRKHDLTKYDSK